MPQSFQGLTPLRHDEHVAGLSVDSSGVFNSIVSETALILHGIPIRLCL